MASKAHIVLVTPASADANNGNWRTAQRWARYLAARYRVTLCQSWQPPVQAPGAECMIALHARRSAASITAWGNHHPERGLAVVLTGTDLYGESSLNSVTRQSLAAAKRVVVLQAAAVNDVPAEFADKLCVIYQSCGARRALAKTGRRLRVVVVGHLRAEKSPRTVFDLARRLAGESRIQIDHIGRAIDEDMGSEARALSDSSTIYRWLGELSHAVTRDRIQRAHLLLHPSCVEGGAHVVMESVRSGTPVLASRIAGNLGMLGDAYPGYFDLDDPDSLVQAILRARDTLEARRPWLAELASHCEARAAIFSPEREKASLLALVDSLRPAG